MNKINHFTPGSYRPRSLIEFLLGDGTSPGWLDRAFAAANLCPLVKPSPVPFACGSGIGIIQKEVSNSYFARTSISTLSPDWRKPQAAYDLNLSGR